MSESSNPIDRTLDRFRAIVACRLGIERDRIQPDTELEALIPVALRRQIWEELREQGLKTASLELPRRFVLLPIVCVAVVALVALVSRSWYAVWAGIPMAIAVFLITRPWAVQFPLGIRTAEELAIYMTNFRETENDGHQWTRQEISIKVRLIVANALGKRLSEVHEECTWEELGER